MKIDIERPYESLSRIPKSMRSTVIDDLSFERRRSKNLFLAEFDLNNKRIEKGNQFVKVLDSVKKSK